MNHDGAFSVDELAELQAHGIVLFGDRVIFDAQPAMSEAEIEAVQSLCSGPLPSGLLDLWRTTAGGRLDYDLTLTMAEHVVSVSWSELFYSGSDHYMDLQGWIEHELSLITESALDSATSRPLLDYLPFGGAEYYSRIYAIVDPEHPDRGGVLAWQAALPPTWRHRLHEDGVATMATSVEGAFAALHLSTDPLTPTDEFFTGNALIEYLDEHQAEHGLDPVLGDRLITYYRRALVDWRAPLADGTLSLHPPLARVAIHHAIATDDPDLVAALADAQVRFDGPLSGSALATAVALGSGAFATTAALVRAGAPVASDALTDIDAAISPELTRALLDSGAEADVRAMARSAACGAADTARLIGRECGLEENDLHTAFADARRVLLSELETALGKATDPAAAYFHYLGVEGLAARIENLLSFEL